MFTTNLTDRIDLFAPLIERFLELYPEAENGPAHTVLGDYNLDDESIASAMHNLTVADEEIGWPGYEFLSALVILADALQINAGELVE